MTSDTPDRIDESEGLLDHRIYRTEGDVMQWLISGHDSVISFPTIGIGADNKQILDNKTFSVRKSDVLTKNSLLPHHHNNLYLSLSLSLSF